MVVSEVYFDCRSQRIVGWLPFVARAVFGVVKV
jgi:hypothetical protein